MQSNIYVSLSAQLALQRRLETVAGNVANASTPGFRAEEVSFEELLSTKGKEPVSFVSKGQSHLSLSQGELTPTGSPFDVAVRGSGWFAVQTPHGTAYTRDGRMQMTTEGVLTNIAGRPFLDIGGSPIQLDPEKPPPVINKAGKITQDGQEIGSLGIYRIPPHANLTRAEGSAVYSDQQAIPELDFIGNGIVQGYVEKSNVSPMLEMTHLIKIQRSFEAVSNMIDRSETSLQNALKTIAGS
jgi:flagellar basal-body rod protein FlgF